MPSLHLENSIVDDRYEVRRRLNTGSYAEIFEAYDSARERRRVIIKALNTSLQGTPEPDLERTLVENFQNEAVALDRVSHPNIVRRLGHGTAADLAGVPFHYIVLEYMSGGDLMHLCRSHPLSLPDALYYFEQICNALTEAHSKGIIHRDIKPQNLLLSANHKLIKITDFGVAKLELDDPDAELTRVGTDLYAPPEHNPNSDERVLSSGLTPAADVYSLAKTFYVAITGSAPRVFARKPISELPPKFSNEPWSERLVAILARATAAHPADRYATVQAFWDDLSQLGNDALEDEDEATMVRPRDARAATTDLPVAPQPTFSPHLASGGLREGSAPRIVVELTPQSGNAAVVVQPPQPPTSEQDRQAQPPTPPARDDDYSYTEDLKDLIGSGWRRRILILVVVLCLLGTVAGVYYEVHRFVTSQSQRTGTVSTQQLSLRDEPSMSGRRVGALPQGTKVRILAADPTNQWYQVEVVEWSGPVDGEQADSGWVGAKFITVDGQ